MSGTPLINGVPVTSHTGALSRRIFESGEKDLCQKLLLVHLPLTPTCASKGRNLPLR